MTSYKGRKYPVYKNYFWEDYPWIASRADKKELYKYLFTKGKDWTSRSPFRWLPFQHPET